MSQPSRRALLAAGGVGLATALSGCVASLSGTGSSGSAAGTRVADLTVSNHDDRAHAVHVLVLADGEPTYWRSVDAAAKKGNTVDGTRLEGFPAEAGDFTLVVRVDDAPKEEWARFRLDEYSADCVRLDVKVGHGSASENGVDDRDVSVWYSANCGEQPAATDSAMSDSASGSSVARSSASASD